MVNGIRENYTYVYKEFSLRFSVGPRVLHEVTDEGRIANRPKRCEYNNEDKDNNPNILSEMIHIILEI